MRDVAYHIDVFDIKDRSHGDKAELAQTYRLCGRGPFSAMIDAHGGAWIANDAFVNEPNDSAGAAVK